MRTLGDGITVHNNKKDEDKNEAGFPAIVHSSWNHTTRCTFATTDVTSREKMLSAKRNPNGRAEVAPLAETSMHQYATTDALSLLRLILLKL